MKLTSRVSEGRKPFSRTSKFKPLQATETATKIASESLMRATRKRQFLRGHFVDSSISRLPLWRESVTNIWFSHRRRLHHLPMGTLASRSSSAKSSRRLSASQSTTMDGEIVVSWNSVGMSLWRTSVANEYSRPRSSAEAPITCARTYLSWI